MARQLRQTSCFGIYHVMVRGVNKQNIFDEEEDYRYFLFQLRSVADPIDEVDVHQPPPCIIYAFCLMPNYVHLLVREHTESLSQSLQRLTTSYA